MEAPHAQLESALVTALDYLWGSTAAGPVKLPRGPPGSGIRRINDPFHIFCNTPSASHPQVEPDLTAALDYLQGPLLARSAKLSRGLGYTTNQRPKTPCFVILPLASILVILGCLKELVVW